MPEPPDLAPLFQPLTLAGLTIANRVMTSAMTLQYGDAGRISDRHLAFYRERAMAGVGLLMSEQLTATPLSPSPYASAIAAFDERQVDRFGALAEALAPYETRFFAQLFGGGVVGSSVAGIDEWGPVRGPSRIGAPGGETPLPLTAEELHAIAADFARSAANIKAGGLDGVEVHGAHGWLVGQFLSPFYNRREDEYGGSVENRCRVAVEIGRAIRAEVGPDFPVGIALSYDELIGYAGITPEDTLAQLTVFLQAEVYDFFDLSIGSSHAAHHTIASMAVEAGFPLPFSQRAKALVGDRAAIFVAGRIVDPAMAAHAIRDGAADMVAMSRAHLADPHLLPKVRRGATDEITRCVGANVCVARAIQGEGVTCVLTPATGREASLGHGTLDRRAPAGRQRIVIVGAGPAGLRVGAVASARGHHVVVHERGDEPGGHLAAMSWLPTRSGWQIAIEDLVRALERNGGSLRLRSDVDAEQLRHEAPDVVFLATGAAWDGSGASAYRPGRRGIPGATTGATLGLDVALARARVDPCALGAHVVIVDETGTYAPLGLAEVLAAAGVRVAIVTPCPAIGEDAARHLELPHVLPRLRAHGVTIAVDRVAEEIDEDALVLADTSGAARETLVGVDTVVLAIDRLPRDALLHELAGSGLDVRRVGDVVAPRSTAAVVYDAERCGRAL